MRKSNIKVKAAIRISSGYFHPHFLSPCIDHLQNFRLDAFEEPHAKCCDNSLDHHDGQIGDDRHLCDGCEMFTGKDQRKRQHQPTQKDRPKTAHERTCHGDSGFLASDWDTECIEANDRRKCHDDGVHPESRHAPVLKENGLQDQAHQDSGKSHPPEEDPHQAVEREMDTGWANRYMDQGSHKKGCGQDRHLGNSVIVQFF